MMQGAITFLQLSWDLLFYPDIALAEGIKRNNYTLIRLAIKRGAKCIYDNQSLLHWTIAQDQNELLRFLIQNVGMDYREKDENGNTLLHTAASKGNIDAIEFLAPLFLNLKWERKSDKSAYFSNEEGYMPIELACEKKHFAIANFLIEYESHLDEDYLLHQIIAKKKDFDSYYQTILNCLVLSTDKNEKDNNGNTPLHIAVIQKDIMALDTLTRAKADFNMQNNDGNSPLHIAASLGDKSVMLRLINAGADVNKKNSKEQTPFHLAAQKKNIEILLILIRKNANIRMDRNESNRLDREALALYTCFETVATDFVINEEGFFYKNIPLLLACAYGDLPTLKHLFTLECVYNDPFLGFYLIQNNHAPLRSAIKKHDVNMIDNLLQFETVKNDLNQIRPESVKGQCILKYHAFAAQNNWNEITKRLSEFNLFKNSEKNSKSRSASEILKRPSMSKPIIFGFLPPTPFQKNYNNKSLLLKKSLKQSSEKYGKEITYTVKI